MRCIYFTDVSRDSDKKRTAREAGHSSRQQAELFISQQTSLLQYSDTAALVPPVLQAKIKQLVKQNPDMAEAVSNNKVIKQ